MRFTERPNDTPFFKALFSVVGDSYTGAEMAEVAAWCEAQFGLPDIRDAVWVRSGGYIAFRDPDAAFAFKMRWC